MELGLRLSARGSALALSVAVCCAVMATPAIASKGGNSQNAKACQKNGWQNLYTLAGESFVSEQACTSHAARGGTLFTSPYGEVQTLCESEGAPSNSAASSCGGATTSRSGRVSTTARRHTTR